MWLGWAHHNIKPHRLLLVQINVFILAPFSQCVECICIVNLIIKKNSGWETMFINNQLGLLDYNIHQSLMLFWLTD